MSENLIREITGRVYVGPIQPVLTETGSRRAYACDLICAGRVKQSDGEDSTWLIPGTALAAAADKFEGVPSYIDHPSLFGLWGQRQEPSVRDLAGIITSVFFDSHEEPAQKLTGVLRLYDEDENSAGYMLGTLMDQILADKENGLAVPPVGLSAVFYQLTHLDEESGLRITDEIRHVQSVDVVYSPGAAGYIKTALSAVKPNYWVVNSTGGKEDMTEEKEVLVTEEEPIQEETPAVDMAALNSRFEAMEGSIARLTDLMAAHAEAAAVQGVENPIRGMQSGMDQVELALDAMLDGVNPPAGVRPLSGIRELYTLMSGDYEMTGRFMSDRVYLANVNSSTMAALVANALNKRVVSTFMTYPQWWKPGVTEMDFATLQDVRWITLGGVGELPTVSEGAAYTELTWDDQTETASFVKKGGYLGLTIEAIDKDDVNKLRSAPRALAQAAWMTLGKAISAIFTDASGTGPTMSDSVVLFHAATHGNLGTTALSDAAWKTTVIAMMKQTELNSGERMSALTRPKYLWVPIDLEDTAVEILASGEGTIGSADYHTFPEARSDSMTRRLNVARERVITVPFWTDTNNWAAQADPNLYPSIGIGYRYGRTPEIFSVASPTAGLMFSNDVMPVKVRFFYAVGPTDYRGLYKHNV